ncbi:MAG: branched-chain amino acid ABC transporter permease [Eubacterium sp.]|nr:branched-chain amino acid ABC transporter permease [Eubacterium sp.]
MEKKQSGFAASFKKHYLGYIIFGFLISLLPIATKAGVLKTSMIGIVGGTIIYSIVAQGLNINLGFAGLTSLGTAGFMGLGAYASAFFTENLGWKWEAALIVSIAICVILGLVVGLISLRVEGLYLGIITLCIAEIFRKTFEELDPITGGYQGKSASFPTIFFGSWKLNQIQNYVLLAIIMVIMMILTYNLVHGQIGRAMHAMRGSTSAAQAMGISLFKYRLMAFALSTGYAALGGVLYVHFFRFVYPSTWTLVLSLNIVAMVVIGGSRTIFGPFLGAVIVYSLQDLVIKRIPVIGDLNGISYIISGVLIILVVMFYPKGVINFFSSIGERVSKSKEAKAAAAAAVQTESAAPAQLEAQADTETESEKEENGNE